MAHRCPYRFLALLVCCFSLCFPFRAVAAASLEALPDFIHTSMQRWHVPGLALVVVQDGETLLARGFGVRDVQKGGRVDVDTSFAIGSASKAFTATALSLLHQEGLLDLEAPVMDTLPGFAVQDPWVARNITLVDMLSHRTGIKGRDIVWVWQENALSREEIVGLLRQCPQDLPFRAAWDYNNLMYLAAGQALAAAAGKSWDACIEERIFTPLEMKASNTSVTKLSGDNVAMPHMLESNRAVRIPYRNLDNVAPAGSINSSIRDMEKWLRFQLSGDMPHQGGVTDSEVLERMRLPRFALPMHHPNPNFPGANYLAYGMGWFLHDHNGESLVEHGGNIDGMTALVAMIPERKAGLVLLCNMNTSRIREVVMYHVFDLLQGRSPADWNKHFMDIQRKSEQSREDATARRQAQRVQGTSPTLHLDAYAGTYVNPVYGEIRIANDGGHLVFHYLGRGESMNHWHYDTFQRPYYSMEEPDIELVTFQLDASGAPTILVDDIMGAFERAASE
jgi:CubicO group peptidase (beta-lactamase class C family)